MTDLLLALALAVALAAVTAPRAGAHRAPVGVLQMSRILRILVLSGTLMTGALPLPHLGVVSAEARLGGGTR